MNWLQLIERRRSVRQYEPNLDAATAARVKGICLGVEKYLPTPLELKVLSGSQVHGVIRGFGPYGRVLSPGYIAAISPSAKDAQLNLGYCTQRAILEMTALGLGTCWIGGFFDKNTLKSDLNIDGEQGIMALVALGWPRADKKVSAGRSGKRTLPDKLAVFDPDSDSACLPWRAVMEAVRWAPSALNRQPWRLWFTGRAVHLYSASGMLARVYTPIEMGIALCHIKLACRQLAIPGQISTADHPQRKGWEYWVSFVRD